MPPGCDQPGTLGPLLLSLLVTLVEELTCAGQAKTIRKLQGKKRLGQLQPLPQTLRAWALLQLDGPPRVCRAASAGLASAAKNKSFREKVRRAEGAEAASPPGCRSVSCGVLGGGCVEGAGSLSRKSNKGPSGWGLPSLQGIWTWLIET